MWRQAACPPLSGRPLGILLFRLRSLEGAGPAQEKLRGLREADVSQRRRLGLARVPPAGPAPRAPPRSGQLGGLWTAGPGATFPPRGGSAECQLRAASEGGRFRADMPHPSLQLLGGKPPLPVVPGRFAHRVSTQMQVWWARWPWRSPVPVCAPAPGAQAGRREARCCGALCLLRLPGGLPAPAQGWPRLSVLPGWSQRSHSVVCSWLLGVEAGLSESGGSQPGSGLQT